MQVCVCISKRKYFGSRSKFRSSDLKVMIIDSMFVCAAAWHVCTHANESASVYDRRGCACGPCGAGTGVSFVWRCQNCVFLPKHKSPKLIFEVSNLAHGMCV